MNLSTSVKPLSYLKTRASRLIRDIEETQGTLVVTHNGRARAVVQDIRSYERTQEALALLKILTRSQHNVRRGKTKTFDLAAASLEKRIRTLKDETV